MTDTTNNDKPAAAPRTVEDLQRELLAICKGGSFAETWRKVNGITEWANLKGEISKLARIRSLREQIIAIDPNAALYYGWGGYGDDTRHEHEKAMAAKSNGSAR